MTPAARLLPALLVAVVAVGALLWWLERPLAPVSQPPAVAGDDAADTDRARRIRELRRRLQAHREAIAAARARRDTAGDELERLRQELAGTRAEIERLEARTGDADAAAD